MAYGMEIYDTAVHVGPGPVRYRQAEPRGKRLLPPDTIVVSVDNHWSMTDDIFFERFPAHLKDRAPRVVREGDKPADWLVNGQSQIPPAVRKHFDDFELVPGCYDLTARLRDLDTEGVDKEIAFGNSIAAFYTNPDVEVREWMFRIYNEHLAEMQEAAPGRFYGVGLINFWQPERTRESIAHAKGLGLKTIMIPQNPYGPAMTPLNYCLPEMDPMWAAIADSGLPLCFHVGEFFKEGPGGVGTTAMVGFGPFRKNLGELIFGGIFDRYPELRVVFIEADINWVPGALQTADMVSKSYAHLIEPKIEESPAYYWQKHCYASFMSDPVGLKMLDLIGADKVMWSSDYPHPESVFGQGWQSIQDVVEAVSPSDARRILGGMAMELFELD